MSCKRVVGVEADSARSGPVAGHGSICGAATTRNANTAVDVKRLAVEKDFGCIAGGILRCVVGAKVDADFSVLRMLISLDSARTAVPVCVGGKSKELEISRQVKDV